MLSGLALGLVLGWQQGNEGAPDEIHLDERCRVFSQVRPDAGAEYSKPKFHSGEGLCTLRVEKHSSHWEETVYQGVVNRTKVQIRERDYVLYNSTQYTVAFVMAQSLPDGWTVDSVPQPVEVVDHVATFRVYAQPGQTVKLHIGERK